MRPRSKFAVCTIALAGLVLPAFSVPVGSEPALPMASPFGEAPRALRVPDPPARDDLERNEELDVLMTPPPSPHLPVPTATFQVRVKNGPTLTWVPNVPLAVDFNGDFVLDGTLTVTVVQAPPRVCLALDARLLLLGPRDTRIELFASGVHFVAAFGQLPPTLNVCGEGDALHPKVTLTSPGTNGAITALLERNGRSVAVSVDRTPSNLAFAMDLAQAGRVVVDHSASTSLRVEFTVSQPNVHAVIDRLPSSFDGEIAFLPAGFIGTGRVAYTANAGIGLVQTTWGNAFDADFLSVTLQNLPARLDVTSTLQHEGSQGEAFRLSQSASAAYGPFSFFLRSANVPLSVSAAEVPANIFSARVDPTVFVDGEGSARLLFDSDGLVRNLAFEFGRPPGPFPGTRNYVVANVDALPAFTDAALTWDARAHTRAAVRVSASAPTTFLAFRVVLDHGDLDVTGNLFDVPAAVVGEASFSGTAAVPGAPGVSYAASSSGFDLLLDARGFDFAGGFLVVQAIDVPARLDAWTSRVNGDDVGQLDLATWGTGRLGELFVHAKLPRVLADKPTQEFQADFQGLARATLAFRNFWACPLQACVEFRNVDSGIMWWWNAPPVVWSITLFLLYTVQQLESCFFGPCWVDKYGWNNWFNGFAYLPGQFGLDGRPVRAVGTPSV